MGSREEPTLEASCQTERVPAGAYEEGLGVAMAEISSQNTTTAVAAWIATSSQQLISPTAAGPNGTAFNTNGEQTETLNRRDAMLRPLDLRSKTEISAGIPVRVPAAVEASTQNVPTSPYVYQTFQPNYSQLHFPPGHPPPGMFPFQPPRPCYYDHGGRCYECNNAYSYGPCPGSGGGQYSNYQAYSHVRPSYQGWSGESLRHFPIVPVPRYAPSDPRNFVYSNIYGHTPVDGNQDWVSHATINSSMNPNVSHRFNGEYYGSYPLPHPTPLPQPQMASQAHPQMGNQNHAPLVTPTHAQLVTQTRPPMIPQNPPQIINTTYPQIGNQPNRNTYFYSTGSALRSPEQAATLVSILPQTSEATPQPSSSKKQGVLPSKFNSDEVVTAAAPEQSKVLKKKQINNNLMDRLSLENTSDGNSFDSSSFADVTTVGEIIPSTLDPSANIMEHIVNPALAGNGEGETPRKVHSEPSSKIRRKNTSFKKKQITETSVIFKTPISHARVVLSNKRKRLSEGVDQIEDPSAEHADNLDIKGISEKKTGSGVKKRKSKAEVATPVSDTTIDDEVRKDKATMLNKLRYRLRSSFAQSKSETSTKVGKEMKVSPGSVSTGKTKGKVKKGKKPKASRSLGSTPNGKTSLSPLASKGTYSPDIVSPRSHGSGNDSIDSNHDKMPALDIHFSAEKENEILVKMRSWTLNKLEGETVLHRAATLGLPDVVSYCMSRQIMLNPNCVNYHGYSPLHDACVHGHEKVVEALLTFRAGPSKKAPGGVRPLHLAAKNGHLEIVKLLLTRGADPNLKTEKGESVLDLAEQSVKIFLSSLPSPTAPAPAPIPPSTDQPMSDKTDK